MSTSVRWLSLANTSVDPVHTSSTFGLEERPHRYTAGNRRLFRRAGIHGRVLLPSPGRPFAEEQAPAD